MPFAIIRDGEPVELFPDQPFTTDQIKVQADEAEHYGVKPGKVIEHHLNHPAGALLTMSDDDLARLGIHRFDEPETPPGKHVTSRLLNIRKGKVSVSVTLAECGPKPPPQQPPVLTQLATLLEVTPDHLLDVLRKAVSVPNP